MDWFLKVIVKLTSAFSTPKLVSLNTQSIKLSENKEDSCIELNSKKLVSVERYKLFIYLIDTVLRVEDSYSGTIKIVSVEQCQLRITVDGYASDEDRFFGVNEDGYIELIIADGSVVRTFNSVDEVIVWFQPKKDEEWELALEKMKIQP